MEMKTLTLKNLTIGIILTASSVTYSQSDSVTTYYPNEISIDYLKANAEGNTISTDQKSIETNLLTISDINKITFLTDSMLSISYNTRSDFKLAINRISKIDIKNGSNTVKGIIWGGLIGCAVGVIIGNSLEGSDINYYAPFFGFIGLLAGILTGGVIGGNTTDYDTYDIDEYKSAKTKNLKRILEIDNVRNGKDIKQKKVSK